MGGFGSDGVQPAFMKFELWAARSLPLGSAGMKY